MCCVLPYIQEAAVCVVSCPIYRRLLCVCVIQEAAVCVVSCPIYRRLLCVLCPALYTGGCCVCVCVIQEAAVW